MTTSMSIHKLRVQAKKDRGQVCLQYLQTRTSPVTLKELAAKLGVTPKCVSTSLEPLLDEGKIIREWELRQSVICNKLGWAYVYYAAEKKVKKTRGPKFQYHNPFNLNDARLS